MRVSYCKPGQDLSLPKYGNSDLQPSEGVWGHDANDACQVAHFRIQDSLARGRYGVLSIFLPALVLNMENIQFSSML